MSIKVLQVGPNPRYRGGIVSSMSIFSRNQRWFERKKVFIDFWYTRLPGGPFYFLYVLGGAFKFLLNVKGYDIVHLHVASNGSFFRKFFLLLISKLFRKKVVFQIHGGGFVDFYNSSNFLTRFLVWFSLESSASVIVVSSYFQDLLKRSIKFSTNVFLVHNSAPEFEEIGHAGGQAETRRYFLFSGKLSDQKGVSDLLLAMRIVKDSFPDVQLVLMGDGDVDHWKGLAKEYGLEGSVSFKGWVDGSERAALYRDCLFFCLPSHIESFGLSVLEAMFFGKAIVCSNAGGLTDLVINGENGFLFDFGDVSNLSKLIAMLWGNPSLCQELGSAGYDKAKRDFSVDSGLKKILRIYRESV